MSQVKLSSKVAFSAKLKVIDACVLRESYKEHTGKKGSDQKALLYFGTLLNTKPDENGFSIHAVNISSLGDSCYDLSVSGVVLNIEAFDEYVKEAYLMTGGDEETFSTMSLSMKLAEAVLCSNDCGSPGDVGFNILNSSDCEYFTKHDMGRALT